VHKSSTRNPHDSQLFSTWQSRERAPRNADANLHGGTRCDPDWNIYDRG
jgi:hypothetical protein